MRPGRISAPANVGFLEHRLRSRLYLGNGLERRALEMRQENAMSAVEPARERIARRLHDAVERLRHDMDEVEFWSEVLAALTRPAPDYESTTLLDRFALPLRGSDGPDRTDGLDAEEAPEELSESVSDSRHSRH